ncbi:Inner membrane protein YabI|nr:Inner membrane protein YabI [Candidatus Pantoea persica]
MRRAAPLSGCWWRCWLGWLGWRWWRSGKTQDWATAYLPPERLRWLAPLGLLVAAGAFVAIQFHPMTPMFRELLGRVFFA